MTSRADSHTLLETPLVKRTREEDRQNLSSYFLQEARLHCPQHSHSGGVVDDALSKYQVEEGGRSVLLQYLQCATALCRAWP